MSKLSFRARALDPCKPLPIYLAEELPDLPEYSAINRAVPQMPSGMEKEEESEHHLQRAICTGLIIPTPEVFTTDQESYDRNYPPTYKMPRQMIHMQPLGLEQDIPEYDMDSADEAWINSQSRRLDISPIKFEQMIDRLEKSSGQTVITLQEAKALLKEDDEISVAVYDYWLNKRLKIQHPLIPSVRTENRSGTATNNPYLAFRRRTEKMQTRKNRKNDETSYEKMLKLRRDLCRTVTLLEMVKRREKMKREHLHLSVEIFEKRYQIRDFSGSIVAEITNSIRNARSAFAPIFPNQYSHHSSSISQSSIMASSASLSGTGHHHHYSTSQYLNSTISGGIGGNGITQSAGSSNKRGEVDITSSRKEKRQYKKRKHKLQRDKHFSIQNSSPIAIESTIETDEEDLTKSSGTHLTAGGSEGEEEGPFAFKRNKNCNYHKPLTKALGSWPWESNDQNGKANPKYRYTLASIRHPRPRCIGFARRRLGRGGRVVMDRAHTSWDDFWKSLDYKVLESWKKVRIENSEECDVTNEDENISYDPLYISSSTDPISNDHKVSRVSLNDQEIVDKWITKMTKLKENDIHNNIEQQQECNINNNFNNYLLNKGTIKYVRRVSNSNVIGNYQYDNNEQITTSAITTMSTTIIKSPLMQQQQQNHQQQQNQINLQYDVDRIQVSKNNIFNSGNRNLNNNNNLGYTINDNNVRTNMLILNSSNNSNNNNNNNNNINNNNNNNININIGNENIISNNKNNSGIVDKNVIKADYLGLNKNDIENNMDCSILEDENINLSRISNYINVRKATGATTAASSSSSSSVSDSIGNFTNSSNNNNNANVAKSGGIMYESSSSNNYIYISSGNLTNNSNYLHNYDRVLINNSQQKILHNNKDDNYIDNIENELVQPSLSLTTSSISTETTNEVTDSQMILQKAQIFKEQENDTEIINQQFKRQKKILQEEVKNWLHFRPKTPDDSTNYDNDKTLNNKTKSSIKENESSSIVNFTESTPLEVQLQRIINDEEENNNCNNDNEKFLNDNDPNFTTTLKYSDIVTDDQLFNSTLVTTDSSNSGIDFNFSGDSLNDLNLSLGEDENEKILENILQECQIGDIKDPYQTTFWNGILDDGGLFDAIDDGNTNKTNNNKQSSTSITTNNCDLKDNEIGFASDLLINSNVQLDDKDNGGGKRSLKRKFSNRNRVGHSEFKLTNLVRDEDFFQKHEQKSNLIPTSTIDEPPEEILASPPPPPASTPTPTPQPQQQPQTEVPVTATTSTQKNIIVAPMPVTVLPVTVSNVGVSVINNNSSSNHQSVVNMSSLSHHHPSSQQQQQQQLNLSTNTTVQTNNNHHHQHHHHHHNTVLTNMNVVSQNTIQIPSQTLNSDTTTSHKIFVKQRLQQQQSQELSEIVSLNSNVVNHPQNTIFTLANIKIDGDLSGNNGGNSGVGISLHSSSANLIGSGDSGTNNNFGTITTAASTNGTNISVAAANAAHVHHTSSVLQHAPIIVTSKQHQQHQQHQLQQQQHQLQQQQQQQQQHQHQSQHQHIIVQQITQNPQQIINVTNATPGGITMSDGNGGTIVLSSGSAAKRQINGPVERQGIPHFLKQTKLIGRKLHLSQQQQQQQQPHQQHQQHHHQQHHHIQQQHVQTIKQQSDNESNNSPNCSKLATVTQQQITQTTGNYIKMQPYPVNVSDLNVQNNLSASALVASNHNYSLQPSAQPITIIGQQQQSGNKIILNTSGTAGTVGGGGSFTITTPIQDVQSTTNKIQYNQIPASNIKVNLVATSAIQPGSLVVDAKSTELVKAAAASSSTVVTSSGAHQQQQQQQSHNITSQQPQRIKLDKTLNMYFDPDQKRVLYTKLVNLSSFQQHKNNSGASQTTVQVTPGTAQILNKAHAVQRLTNAQAIVTNMRSLPVSNQVVASAAGASVHHHHQTIGVAVGTGSGGGSSGGINVGGGGGVTGSSEVIGHKQKQNNNSGDSGGLPGSATVSGGINLNTTNR